MASLRSKILAALAVALGWNLAATAAYQVTSTHSWLRVQPSSGSLAANSPTPLSVIADAAGLDLLIG